MLIKKCSPWCFRRGKAAARPSKRAAQPSEATPAHTHFTILLWLFSDFLDARTHTNAYYKLICIWWEPKMQIKKYIRLNTQSRTHIEIIYKKNPRTRLEIIIKDPYKNFSVKYWRGGIANFLFPELFFKIQKHFKTSFYVSHILLEFARHF